MKTLLLDLYYLGHFLAAELVGRLPSAALRDKGIEALTWFACSLSIAKRRRVQRHVEIAFGSALDAHERRAVERGCFREFWREMVDWVPGAIDGPAAAEVAVRGLDHLEKALAGGRGAILWESNGFSRRVRGKRALHAHGVGICQTHGETHLGVMNTSPEPGTWIRRELLRGTYERRERAWVAEIVDIPLNATVASGRAYLKHLRRNHVLCMAGDGQIARRLYPVSFLGRSVRLAPGAVKLSRLSGAPLLPVFWVPSGEGAPALEIDPPIVPRGEDDESVTACLQQFASALEARVRRWPASYRNWHLLGDELMPETRASVNVEASA
jgi:lauroyl/myristoyl acyltransferase